MRAIPLPPAPFCQERGHDRQGYFNIPYNGLMLRVVASDGSDWTESGYDMPAWEHVSVSLRNRTPTWAEMDFIKGLWWRDDETVIQFHVPRSAHVNYHPFCLHLWKPVGVELPLPPSSTVGPKGKSNAN